MAQSNPHRTWLAERAPWSRRVIKFGLWGFLSSVAIVVVQHWAWLLSGWGSANFLPIWALVLVYTLGLCVGLACFYAFLSKTAVLEGAAKWGTAAFAGVMAALFAISALAGSLPQLSTLVVSRSVSVELQVHSTSDHRRCRGGVWFGPLYRVPGRMCTGFAYWSKGSTHMFHGRGHALAVRIEGF